MIPDMTYLLFFQSILILLIIIFNQANQKLFFDNFLLLKQVLIDLVNLWLIKVHRLDFHLPIILLLLYLLCFKLLHFFVVIILLFWKSNEFSIFIFLQAILILYTFLPKSSLFEFLFILYLSFIILIYLDPAEVIWWKVLNLMDIKSIVDDLLIVKFINIIQVWFFIINIKLFNLLLLSLVI